MKELKVKKIHDKARYPSKAHDSDACYDIFPMKQYHAIDIQPQEIMKIHTGLRIFLPEGTVGRIWPRSGLASMGIQVMGGVIDPGYTGEWIIMLANVSNSWVQIETINAVAQLGIFEILPTKIKRVKEIPDTDRGTRGFGSTNLEKGG